VHHGGLGVSSFKCGERVSGYGLLVIGAPMKKPLRPTRIEEVSRKMRDTAGGTPALPSEKVASSSLFYILKNMSLTY
jgi:hypothetical protein